jgi:hypothetical protein
MFIYQLIHYNFLNVPTGFVEKWPKIIIDTLEIQIHARHDHTNIIIHVRRLFAIVPEH